MENKKRPATASNTPPLDNKDTVSVDDWYDHNIHYENDYYIQRGDIYKQLSDDQQQGLISNIVHVMGGINGPDKEMAINMQLCHWFRIDIGLGIAVARGLDLDLGEAMKNMPVTF